MNNYDVMIGKSNEKSGRAPYFMKTVMAKSKKEAVKIVAEEFEVGESYQEEMFALLSDSTLDK